MVSRRPGPLVFCNLTWGVSLKSRKTSGGIHCGGIFLAEYIIAESVLAESILAESSLAGFLLVDWRNFWRTLSCRNYFVGAISAESNSRDIEVCSGGSRGRRVTSAGQPRDSQSFSMAFNGSAMVIQLFSMVSNRFEWLCNGFQLFSMVFNGFQWFAIVFAMVFHGFQ